MWMVKASLVLGVIGGVLGAAGGAARADGDVLGALAEAIAKHDEPAFVALTGQELSLEDLWFADTECAKQFSGKPRVPSDRFPLLFHCLTTLGLRAVTETGGGTSLIYEPGVHVETWVFNGKLLVLATRWIGDPGAAPVTPEALAAHTVSGMPPIEPDDQVRQAVAQAPDQPAFAELMICVDPSGAVERAVIRHRSEGHDSYVRAVEERGVPRKLKPFLVHGKPVRACGTELFVYPEDARAKVLKGSGPSWRRPTDEAATAQALVDAIHAKDAAAFARLVPASARLSSLWFPDPGCAKRFSGELAPTEASRPALLACLAGLGLHVGRVKWTDWPEWTALIYDPGVALKLQITGDTIAAMGTDWSSTADAASAPVSAEALEAHLPAGATDIEPDETVRDAIAAAPDKFAAVMLMTCVDRTGHPDSVRVLREQGAVVGYSRAVVAAATAWTFTPFTVGGKPVRVCGTTPVVYPADRKALAFAPPPPPPPPPAPPQNVVPTEMDAHRIAGAKNIVPDDETKLKIAESGKDRLIGTYKICILPTGEVKTVSRLKSTGFPAYDEKIVSTIRQQWRYAPFDTKAPLICSSVTFIYTQK